MNLEGIKLDFLGHSGFAFKVGNEDGKRIVIDPYNVSEEALKEKADIVLITHCHYDHCSIKDVEKLVKPGSVVVMTADCQSKIMKLNDVRMEVVEVGDKLDLAGGVKVEAIAAYNKDKEFHPKSEGWVGYLIKVKDFILYHSGDSDFIPEMHRLSGYGKRGNKFVGLFPVSGKFVMDPDEAVEAASLISPDLCIPIHYGAGVAGDIEDAERFVELCKEKGLNAELLEKI